MFAYAISYRFTKPVTRMIQSIQLLENHLNAEWKTLIQEFHDMGIVFNEMADSIEYLITRFMKKKLWQPGLR